MGDDIVAAQRARLGDSTKGRGFGPQSPRDIDARGGDNSAVFSPAPPARQMNLCNIHFHSNAEHRGGEFTRYAGNGDGQGHGSGYRYSGSLTERELLPPGTAICQGKHGGLTSGDTIEVHYVFSSARVGPGPTLGACMNDATRNPQLRVEAQVYVLVNDPQAADFRLLAAHRREDGFHRAINMPDDTGDPVEYAGSTTGPRYSEQGSPFQVFWSVRPRVAKVDIRSLGEWCQGNAFEEDHAHGVRNLVLNPALLSAIHDD